PEDHREHRRLPEPQDGLPAVVLDFLEDRLVEREVFLDAGQGPIEEPHGADLIKRIGVEIVPAHGKTQVELGWARPSDSIQEIRGRARKRERREDSPLFPRSLTTSYHGEKTSLRTRGQES